MKILILGTNQKQLNKVALQFFRQWEQNNEEQEVNVYCSIKSMRNDWVMCPSNNIRTPSNIKTIMEYNTLNNSSCWVIGPNRAKSFQEHSFWTQKKWRELNLFIYMCSQPTKLLDKHDKAFFDKVILICETNGEKISNIYNMFMDDSMNYVEFKEQVKSLKQDFWEIHPDQKVHTFEEKKDQEQEGLQTEEHKIYVTIENETKRNEFIEYVKLKKEELSYLSLLESKTLAIEVEDKKTQSLFLLDYYYFLKKNKIDFSMF